MKPIATAFSRASDSVLVLTAVFIFREWKTYFKDPYNYFDWLGLILTFLVIPLRFAEVRSQWSVAALGYLFNFLRLFKFSCVTRYSLFVNLQSLSQLLKYFPFPFVHVDSETIGPPVENSNWKGSGVERYKGSLRLRPY